MDKEFQNYYDNLNELKEVISENEYRLSFATITVYSVMNYYSKNNIKYTRQDLMQKVNRILVENNMEEFSYFFFRKFSETSKQDSKSVGVG